MQNPNTKSLLIKFTEYIIELFRQGLTPRKIALSVAIGICGGAFPVLGLATPVCALLAIIFKLNMGIVQIINYAAAPIHFILIPIFLWLGSFLPWNQPLVFDPIVLRNMIPHTWGDIIKLLTSYLLGAIVVWMIFMPIVTSLLYFLGLLWIKLIVKYKKEQ